MHLTEAVNSLQGSMVIAVNEPLSFFKARYKLLMGDPTTARPMVIASASAATCRMPASAKAGQAAA